MKAAEQRNLQPEAHSSEGGGGHRKTSFYSLLPEFSCCLSSSTLSARPSIYAARPDPRTLLQEQRSPKMWSRAAGLRGRGL